SGGWTRAPRARAPRSAPPLHGDADAPRERRHRPRRVAERLERGAGRVAAADRAPRLEPRPRARRAAVPRVDARELGPSPVRERVAVVRAERARRLDDGRPRDLLETVARLDDLLAQRVGREAPPRTVPHAVAADDHARGDERAQPARVDAPAHADARG